MPLLLVLHQLARSTAQQQSPIVTATATQLNLAATSTVVAAVTATPSPDSENMDSSNHEEMLLPIIAVLIGGLCVLLLILSTVRFAVYKCRLWNTKRSTKTRNEVSSTKQSVPFEQGDSSGDTKTRNEVSSTKQSVPSEQGDSSGDDHRSTVRSWAPYVDAQFIHPNYHNLKPLVKEPNIPAAGKTPQSHHCLDPLSMDYTHLYVTMEPKDCSEKKPSVVALTEPTKRDYRGIEVSKLETPTVYSRPKITVVI